MTRFAAKELLTRMILISFQGSRAILDLHYGERHARLELDQFEHRYSGQRAREEIQRLADQLSTWLTTPGQTIETA